MTSPRQTSQLGGDIADCRPSVCSIMIRAEFGVVANQRPDISSITTHASQDQKLRRAYRRPNLLRGCTLFLHIRQWLWEIGGPCSSVAVKGWGMQSKALDAVSRSVFLDNPPNRDSTKVIDEIRYHGRSGAAVTTRHISYSCTLVQFIHDISGNIGKAYSGCI